jgi:hypothetical protein
VGSARSFDPYSLGVPFPLLQFMSSHGSYPVPSPRGHEAITFGYPATGPV